MDWTSLFSDGATLAAIAAAAVAFWQAVVATRQARAATAASEEAGRRADEANRALARSADAHETIALAHRPNAWGNPMPASDYKWAIRNSSGREMVVHGVEASPARAGSLLQVEGTLPASVRAGGLLRFDADARLGLVVDSFTIVWSFADDTDQRQHRSERLLRR
ncbi:hypothetical protein [Agrococcus sp. BE272]|uniref:hypothetical protein n=1 Tax=Agrococcus sp. BE272 TaxID=2817727 RepID=UPI0028573BB4|nr:hypothetical protein [Agrococcus sp. BE272]MDR7233603.1 cytochrome c5 [Agrococcus sp. BE272]